MLTRQLSLKRGLTAPAASISEDREIRPALIELGIPHPRPVIVLVGGAGGIGWLEKFPMSKAVRIVARLAEEAGAVVVDGGTQAGIMSGIGIQRKLNKLTFPLVGVIFDKLLTQEKPQSVLEPNHTHFLLIPGHDWGAESAWIARIATAIAGDRKSITVLINGGKISRTDVEFSLREDRPTFVMRGTGRLADEISLTGKVFAIDIANRSKDILESLRPRLMDA